MSFYIMHRGWPADTFFKDDKYCERAAWHWLIHEAAYADHNVNYYGRLILIKRGQVPTSYRRLREAWKWSYKRIECFLNRLVTTQRTTHEIVTGF